MWRELDRAEKPVAWLFVASQLATVLLAVAGSTAFLDELVYIALWIGGAGLSFWTWRTPVAARLRRLPLPPFIRFMALGIAVILVEEALAAFANVLREGFSLQLLLTRIPQYQISTLTAFVPFFAGWYLVQRRYGLPTRRALLLAGVGGGFVETWSLFFSAAVIPLVLIYPSAIAGYAVITFLPLASLPQPAQPPRKRRTRYVVALIVPSLMEFVGVVTGVTLIRQVAPQLLIPGI